MNSGKRDRDKAHREATALAAESKCLACGTTPSEPCHWPVNRGSGGRFENEWDPSVWVPLCRKHHSELDKRNGVSAYEQEKTRIVRYIVSVRAPEWHLTHRKTE